MTRILSTLIGKLVPLLEEILEMVPNLETAHYWTDSPTSQYRRSSK